MNFRIKPLFSLALTLLPAAMHADPLDFDPSFAGDGNAEYPFSTSAYAAKGYIESSGESVLFGYSDNGNASNGEGIMLRLAADGSEDTITRFGAAGFGCSAPRNFLAALRLANDDYATGGYVQPGCSGVPRYLNVLRLTPAGIRVDEFDQVVFANQLAYAFALAEQADGKILAAGYASSSGFDGASYDFAVARFLTDGSLDPVFGNGGTFVYDVDGGRDIATGIVVDDDGTIFLAGSGTSATTGRDMVVLGLTRFGTLDPSFGTGGVFSYDRAGFNESVGAMAFSAQRLLVAGTSRSSEDAGDLTVIGINRDGQLDPGFSDDGIVTVDFGTTLAGASDLTVGPTGRIYVTGSAEVGGTGLSSRDGLVAVLQPSGRLDPIFNGGAGKLFTFGGQPGDLPADIEIDAIGSRILVTGYTANDDNGSVRYFAAARLMGYEQVIFSDRFEVMPVQ